MFIDTSMNLLPSIARCLVLDGVDMDAVRLLESKGVEVRVGPSGPSADELIEIIEDFTPTAVIVRSATKVTARVMDAVAFCVRILARAGVGVDNIDLACASRHGILVINAPHGNTLSAAEHTCALFLSMSRQLPSTRVTDLGCWRAAKNAISKAPIMEVYGKTLGILGLGKIGSAVGVRMHAFGMRVIGYDPLWDESKPLPVWLSHHCSIDEVLAESDYISLHLPLLPSTKNLINASSLAKCKRGVRIINCSRGGVLDEKAVLAALESGQCGFLGLDVLEQEPPSLDSITIYKLMQRTDVIITPHLGASSNEAQVRVAVEVADSILAIGHLSTTPLTGLESGLNLNKIGVKMRRILQGTNTNKFLEDFHSLSELVIVGALSTSMDPCIPVLSSFKARVHFSANGEEETEVLNEVLKQLLADLLFKHLEVFPDVLKSLIVEVEKEGCNDLKFQSQLKDDQIAVLELTLTGEGDVTLSRQLALMSNEKGRSVLLLEKDGQKLVNPLNLGGLPLACSKTFKLFG